MYSPKNQSAELRKCNIKGRASMGGGLMTMTRQRYVWPRHWRSYDPAVYKCRAADCVVVPAFTHNWATIRPMYHVMTFLIDDIYKYSTFREVSILLPMGPRWRERRLGHAYVHNRLNRCKQLRESLYHVYLIQLSSIKFIDIINMY